LLTKDEQKKVRKNLREYGKIFDEQDYNKKNLANRAVIEHRRRLLDEWRAWRAHVIEEELHDEAVEVSAATEGTKDEGDSETIEEIVEEIIDETEEIID
jgi:translation initiation factor 3 subunit B